MRPHPSQIAALLLLAPLLCGFEKEAEQLESYTQGLLEVVESQQRCDLLARQVETWLDDNQQRLEAARVALETSFDQLGPATITPARTTLNTLVRSFIASPAHARLLACQVLEPSLERSYEAFLQASFVPIHTALEARAQAIDAFEAQRPADARVVEASLLVLTHYLPSLDRLVAEYATDCTRLSAAVDSWVTKNYEVLERARDHLVNELPRMSSWDLSRIQPQLDTLTLATATTETLERCSNTLTDHDKKVLDFASSFVVKLVEKVDAAVP